MKELKKITEKELKEILENHQLWLDSDYEKGKRADLSSTDLSGFNLEKADLSRASLFKANLEEANLAEANLAEADLTKADLTKANLRFANLTKANLRFANLTAANLSWANFDFASWPLWCGSKEVTIDNRLAYQLIMHCRDTLINIEGSEFTNLIEEMKPFAEKCHRASEFGVRD